MTDPALRDVSAHVGAPSARRQRILALDLAKAGALIAMALFHFVFDLEMFGWLAPGTSTTGGWRVLALCTAGSFIFLAGISLWLAQGQRRNWPGFWVRFLRIAGAAFLVTVATWAVFPEAFVFFGILHAIAAASLVGMAFLSLPAAVLILMSAGAFLVPEMVRFAAFDAPWLWWTGMQTVPVRAVDYVPLFPWLGPFLAGIAVGRIGTRAGLWDMLASWDGGGRWTWAAWAGRHSLLVYLVHQPVLIALVGAATFMLR